MGSANCSVGGFDDEVQNVMEFLVGDVKHLGILSIVGMPGLGKTCLARKIYCDPRINHFHVRAWCSVPQAYERKNLLLEILGYVIQITDEIRLLDDEELARRLYQSLKGRRYLIVIDDMFTIDIWTALKRCFPDDKNHSRILITSIFHDMASKIKDGSNSKVHALRSLTKDESWDLFREKLIERGSFFEEFEDVLRQIATNCNGLPLAIVAKAEYLTQVNRSVQRWEQIAGQLSSRIMSDSQSQCRQRLELRYSPLQDNLRSCFLYLAAFPKDKDISCLKLKLLWIAEGFVQSTQTENLEDEAETYFKHLVNSSLVTATKERSLGGIKLCRINDFLHEFCLEKAKEDSFLHVIKPDSCALLRLCDVPRVSICSKNGDFVWAEAIGHSVCSLLHTAMDNEISQFDPYDVSFIFQKFQRLRVLDFACIYIDECFTAIESLIQLRYLALGAGITSIPSSISKLQNLQYFLVRFCFDGEVVEVPGSLWDMVNLRHVCLDHYASFDVHGSSSKLDNLQTLSGPCLSPKNAQDLLRRLPKLRKLRCFFRGIIAQGNDSISCQFPELGFLDQLISLKVTFEGSKHSALRCEFNFPSNLQKLTLLNFGLPWVEISKIGMELSNLKVLKLLGGDWDDTWTVNDEEFLNLRYLKLGCLKKTVEWMASDSSFCKLEHLVLDNCLRLEEIPDRFADIPTLQIITVKNCKDSVVESARRIEEEQREGYGKSDFKVHINPKML